MCEAFGRQEIVARLLAPTLVSEESTSTTNWKSGSTSVRTGTEVKKHLSSWEADSASGDKWKGEEVKVKVVSGAARWL